MVVFLEFLREEDLLVYGMLSESTLIYKEGVNHVATTNFAYCVCFKRGGFGGLLISGKDTLSVTKFGDFLL
jgi:hypothetical protein